MKISISILVIFLILGLTKSSTSNNPVFHSGNDTSQCIRTVQWGSIQTCLPVIQGMTECFSHPAIIAKNAKTETKEDESFAFYLNNETHKRIDSLDKINYDNYFKIYSLKGIKNEPADQSALNQLDEMVQNNSFRVSWDSIKQNTIKNSNRITIGQPALIDHYSPNENIRSFILSQI